MDSNEYQAIRGVAAKVEMIERMVSELMGSVQEISQRIKQTQFTISQGYDPMNHLPKGEGNTAICDNCGARKERTELMNKAANVGEDIISQKLCKKCFYGRK